MTQDKIIVLGHDVELLMTEGIPLACRESFYGDLKEMINEAIADGDTTGICEMCFYEEISGEQVETDVDVKWKIIDWKQIATDLYEAMNDTHNYNALDAMKEYEKAIKP